MYKLCPDFMRKPMPSVIRMEDGACIPFALDNRDYQEYLKWIEDGNTPLPADE